MKALTIYQPWAHLIMFHGKDIENRKWRTNLRGRIYVHAGKVVDEKAMVKYKRLLGSDDLIRGAIIGSVEIVDCVDWHHSDWFEGPFGLILRDPKPEPIRFMPGKMKFWEVKP